MQRIAVLDIRLLNMDRHANNLLVSRRPVCANDDSLCYARAFSSRAANPAYRSQSTTSETVTPSLRLVPIDHGYALPRTSTAQVPEWCWMQWYQSKQPVTGAVRADVEALDAESDVELLRWYLPGIEEEALNTLRVNTLWLKLVGGWEACEE